MKFNNNRPDRLRKIIELYLRQSSRQPDEIGERMRFAKSPIESIKIACECMDNRGKRMPHQRRIRKAVLEAWTEAVSARQTSIFKANTFDELHNILIFISSNMKGVGELLVYDTADRIRVYRNLDLEKLYLHAGTRVGAELLYGERLGKAITHENLPSELRKLSFEDLENLFCTCKNLLDSSISDYEFQRRSRNFEDRLIRISNC
jgi:hypothetical protein